MKDTTWREQGRQVYNLERTRKTRTEIDGRREESGVPTSTYKEEEQERERERKKKRKKERKKRKKERKEGRKEERKKGTKWRQQGRQVRKQTMDKEHPMSILCAGSTQREQQQRRKKCQNKLRTSRETGAETDGTQGESFPRSNQNKEH